jgi:putative transposase
MSKKRFELLSGAHWESIAPLLPEPKLRRDNGGGPWASNLACLEGIFWVLQTGEAWRSLPDKYPSPATCCRRLKQWEETFLDGSFAPAK